MNDKQLLAEVDEALAKMPPFRAFESLGGATDSWLGMISAIIDERVDVADRSELRVFNQTIAAGEYAGTSREAALRGLIRLVHKVRHRLLMSTGGTGTIAVDKGMHFQYFDAIRGVVETATSDILFVDQYMDVDAIGRFCVYAKDGVSVRILADRYTVTLEPAVKALNQERGGGVYLRKTNEVHERYVFVDGEKCHLSGASFKDEPKYASSLVSEIVDGADALRTIYENVWVYAAVLV